MCDFAEYYHIYDWHKLPGRYAAALAAGLRPESRSYMSAFGVRMTPVQTFLCMTFDEIRNLEYMLSGSKRAQKPTPITKTMLYGNSEKKEEWASMSIEEFDKLHAQYMGG